MKDRGLSPFDLSALPETLAKQLLGLRDRLLRLEESPDCSDLDASEIVPERIYFKNDPRWIQLHQAIIAELSKREHVPSGAERALRRAKQSQRSNKERKRQMPR